MKVYILTTEPFPNGMAATNRIKCYARAIKEEGVECEVIVCAYTEINPSKIKNTDACGVYEDVHFRYIGGSPIDTRPRPIRYCSQHIREQQTERFLRKKLQKGDIVFLYMSGRVKRMLKFMNVAHQKGAYVVRDLCELPYGAGAETSMTIRRRKVTLEQLFPRLDGIVCISDALMNLALTYTRPSCRLIKIPIMVDFREYCLSDRATEADIPYIFHAGTLYQQKDGILGMIEAFGKAVQRLSISVKFITTGYMSDSPHQEEIERLIAQYQLKDKFQMIGYIAPEAMKDYLSRASMVIINKYRTQQNNYCFSTKLGEYLAAAKPVIITQVGEAMNWLENGVSAYIIEPENCEVLAAAIVRVFNNPEESRKIGICGQEVCRNCFDYRNWSKPLKDFFNLLGK